MTARKPRPIPLADRVAASRTRAIESGARRMPGGILSAQAAAALAHLEAGRERVTLAEISAAIIERAQRKGWRPPVA